MSSELIAWTIAALLMLLVIWLIFLNNQAHAAKKNAIDTALKHQDRALWLKNDRNLWRGRYEDLEEICRRRETEGDLDGDGVNDEDMRYVRKSILGEGE